MASFPSSYIPTAGSTVTRAADVASIAVSGLAYPLTMFVKFNRAVDTGGFENLAYVQNTANERALLFINTSDQFCGSMKSNNVEQLNIPVTGAIAAGASTKGAVRFNVNDSRGARGGTLSAQDTVCALPLSNPNELSIGPAPNELYGYFEQIAIWPTAFSDANLQAVTS